MTPLLLSGVLTVTSSDRLTRPLRLAGTSKRPLYAHADRSDQGNASWGGRSQLQQMRNLTVADMQTLPAPAAASMEEFHESDILWPDDHRCHHHDDDRCCHGHQKQQLKGSRRPRAHGAACRGDARRRPASSAPVAIPVAEPAVTTWAQCYCCEDDEASFVPPHVVVARRWCSDEERAASSMCVGQGRTLKGRDLRCVRTAVLRMTGFLET